MTSAIHRLFLILAVLLTLPAVTRAEIEETSLECYRAGRARGPDNPPSGRHYPRDREVQVLHLAIDRGADRSVRKLVPHKFFGIEDVVRHTRITVLGPPSVTIDKQFVIH